MSDWEKVKYKAIPTKDLTSTYVRMIRNLVYSSTRHQGIPKEQAVSFLHEVDRGLIKPNRGVGHLNQKYQGFSNSVGMMALLDGKLLAYFSVMDNASASRWRRNPLIYHAEVTPKLHVDSVRGRELVGHRYVKLGHAALHPMISEATLDPNTASPLDALAAWSIQQRDERQPVRSWRYGYEFAWGRYLESINMPAIPEAARYVNPFGEGIPVRQWTHEGRPQQDVLDAITVKEDFQRLMVAAEVQLAA